MKFKRCSSTVFFIILLMSANTAIAPKSAYAVNPAYMNLDSTYKPKIPALKINKQTYSYNEMQKDIDSLIKAYPGKIRKKVIGKSFLGREIPVVILGNPKASKKIIVIGSVHGREYISTQLIMKQIEYYLRNPRKTYNGVYIENVLNRACIHFIPMLNPDGVMLSQLGLNSVKDRNLKKKLLRMNKGSYDFTTWKANIRGVDLNRNFNAGWLSIPYIPAGTAAYKGPYAVSEPETWAIVNYITNMNFNAVLTYHSSGQVIYWYFSQKGSAYKRDYKIAASIAHTTGYKLLPKEEKAPTGGLKDWFVQDYRRPGFTIELGIGESPLPFSQFNKIWNENKYIPLLISQQIK